MADGSDIVIVGSGMGGGTLAAALAPSGRRSCRPAAGIRCEKGSGTTAVGRCPGSGPGRAM